VGNVARTPDGEDDFDNSPMLQGRVGELSSLVAQLNEAVGDVTFRQAFGN